MGTDSKKKLVVRYEGILSWLYRLLGCNRIKVDKGNTLNRGNAFMKGCRITIRGRNNLVELGTNLSRLSNSTISIYGSNCKVILMGEGNLHYAHLHIEDDGGQIVLKPHVTISGHTELAVIEGTKIVVGEDCLFSSQISFRTGDSHSILDQATGKRINPSEDIIIGDHVWVGNGVKVLKGVSVGAHSIVATGAVLSGGHYPSHSIIGGIGHGQVLKSGIDWTPQRLPIL